MPNTQSKDEVLNKFRGYLKNAGLAIADEDSNKPWGAYFVIDPAAADIFIKAYFPDFPLNQLSKHDNRLSTKFLVVAPGKRMSWQYHHHRAELWRVVSGPVGVCASPTDDQPDTKQLEIDQTIQFDALVRHRLIGLENWGVIAEIWQHNDPARPSDESDIVRVQDDYGR